MGGQAEAMSYRKTQITNELIEKYTAELKNRNENRAKECDKWNDDQNQAEDDLIKLTARIIRDLKSIK